jgi:hypothetical protein
LILAGIGVSQAAGQARAVPRAVPKPASAPAEATKMWYEGGQAAGPPPPQAAAGTTTTSPTAYKKVDTATRQRILARDQKPDGSWDCATCGQNTRNPDNVHTGHINARSKGGDLSDTNLRCEGAACNLSQGNRPAPKPGRTCAERGSCGAPYGRTD